MKSSSVSARMQLIAAVVLFGTIGLFRRSVPLPSSLIALVRGAVGTATLLALLVFLCRKPDFSAIRRHLPLLLCSGAAIGFNWILLFEAYCYTSVAAATLCYYLAPVLVVLLSPLVLRERITLRQGLCALGALVGMIPVSGLLGDTDIGSAKGILYGLGAALLYASVILMNRKMPGLPAYEKTTLQLAAAAMVLLPYVLATVDFSQIELSAFPLLMLLIMGVVHTGLAYWLYFGAIGGLPAHSAALLSYLDPVVAVLLSALLLKEPFGLSSAIGAAVILISAYICEKGE